MKTLIGLLLMTVCGGAQSVRPAVLKGDGWRSLLNGRDTSGWHSRDGKPHTWYTAKDAHTEQSGTRTLLKGTGGSGPVMLNGPDGRTTDFITDQKFGDIELYLEFMIPPKSNSGVYLESLYEVQILDSFGAKQLGVHDCGAIYERWIDGKGVGGSAPLVNASRAPGEWQSFHIWFRAPRFDSSGKKVQNARFLKVEMNGQVVQRDADAPGPTRAALEIPEAKENPLMLQGDHGPVAFRNLYYRPLQAE
jgi:Domain of Unknown Function (DUF1080)